MAVVFFNGSHRLIAVENNIFHYAVNKVYSEISTIGGEIIKWNAPPNVQSKRPEPTFKKQRTPRSLVSDVRSLLSGIR